MIEARRIGLMLAVAAAVSASLGGILVRNIDTAGDWQVLFVRSLFFAVTVAIFMRVARPSGGLLEGLGRIGPLGILAAVALCVAFIAYVVAIRRTSVASAVFIISTAPFIMAILSRILLAARIPLPTWLFISLSTLGVAVIFVAAQGRATLVGNAVALAAAAGYALYVVLLRMEARTDLMPAALLAGLLCAAVSLVMAKELTMSTNDLLFAALLGVVQIGGQYILITIAARLIEPAELGLVLLLEIVLAPVWVWAFIGEVPPSPVLAGLAVVLVAVLGQSILAFRHSSS